MHHRKKGLIFFYDPKIFFLIFIAAGVVVLSESDIKTSDNNFCGVAAIEKLIYDIINNSACMGVYYYGLGHLYIHCIIILEENDYKFNTGEVMQAIKNLALRGVIRENEEGIIYV